MPAAFCLPKARPRGAGRVDLPGSYGYHRGRCPALMTAGRTEVKRMADEKRRTGLFNRLFGRRDPVFQAPAAPEKRPSCPVFEKAESKAAHVDIPDGVEIIGERAFEGCALTLRSVTIPPSVRVIRERAFCDCLYLTEVRLRPLRRSAAGPDPREREGDRRARVQLVRLIKVGPDPGRGGLDRGKGIRLLLTADSGRDRGQCGSDRARGLRSLL